jgi:hypothetical protein
MAIHFVTGKPGGGKSYFTVRQIVEELRRSERQIITNVALNLDALAEYCHENIEKPVDVNKRIRMLTEAEVYTFWRCFVGMTITKTRRLGEGQDKPFVTDYAELETLSSYEGALFIIDEVHLYFSARDWQKTGPDCEFFFSQHRKLKSDVFLVTQHCEKVDKNMRRNAQDFTVLRNMETEKLWMGVTFKKTLRRATYLQQPVRGDAPMESGYFRLDVAGLGKLYNTAAGVGIVGRLDVRENHGGRGIWVWVALAVVAALCAWVFPQVVGFGAKKFINGAQVGTVTAFTNTIPKLDAERSQERVTRPVLAAVGVDLGAQRTNRVENAPPPARVSGLVPAYPERGFVIFLSDGRKYKTIDGEVNLIARDHVLIGTNRYEMR